MARTTGSHEYPDDIFDHTRMSFGDHIEELRMRMVRALMGLLFCLVIGFVLDAVGESVGNKNIGIGRPMLDIITDPVETQVRDFYSRRNEKEAARQLSELTLTPVDEILEIQKELEENGGSISDLSAEKQRKLLEIGRAHV